MAIPSDLTVRTYSILTHLIFSPDNIQSMDTLENALTINGYDLFTHFPPKYQNMNKKALFDDLIQQKNYKPSKRDLLITRFHPKQLPISYTIEQHLDKSTAYTFLPSKFDYLPNDDPNVLEWHMNFANYNVFSFYQGNLLAQDELQVLECPQLASLREYFSQQNEEKTNQRTRTFSALVIEKNLPYPILISNIERVLDLNTKNLYGNTFSSSPTATVLNSYTYLDPPQIVNIIAIEAPKYGFGAYTSQQIEYILQECFTAYTAAKTLADITYVLNNQRTAGSQIKTHIHTGWFGCGAYGGNRIIMTILQILAAKMAGIDKLIFHTVTSDYQQEIDAAETCLTKMFSSNQSKLSRNELIEKISSEGFHWGSSNGT